MGAAGGHRHDHAHGPHTHGPGGPAPLLGRAFWVASVLLLAEVGGGLVSHSLALFSDAGHMLTDVLSLGLAWYASRLAVRPPTPKRTYGYHRAGILAALFNAGTLIVVAAAILVEAVARLRHPVPVIPWVMWSVAALGLVGNLAMGLSLGHSDHGGNINVRGAWLHVMGDAAASAGVLAAGILIAVTHRLWWDPVVSAAIALLIARGAWALIAQTLNILMEGAPPGVSPDAVASDIEADAAVLSVHHIHVWSLDGTRTALSGHVVLRDGPLSEAQEVVARLARRLRERYAIEHTTLQLESQDGRPCPDGDCGPQPAAGAARMRRR
jgi:cobalt-zinc-cadmium efflux system protein